MQKITDFIHEYRKESTKRLEIAEGTKRHGQSCERDVKIAEAKSTKKIGTKWAFIKNIPLIIFFFNATDFLKSTLKQYIG